MPKRAREDEVKPAPRLSAVAQRRLREQQQTTPGKTDPAAAAAVAAAVDKESTLPATASNEDLAKKRAEIEAKLRAQQTTAVRSLGRHRFIEGRTPRQPSPELAPSPSRGEPPIAKSPSPAEPDAPPTSRTEESALSRIKRAQRDRNPSATTDNEDVEMQSTVGTDGDDEAMDSGTDSRNPKLIQISSFVPTDENNSISDLGCVFRLQPGETLVLAGTYQLVVVKGSISVSGAKLSHNSPPHIVHAPMTHSLPIIEVLSSKRQTSTCTEVLVTTFHSSLLDIGKLCPTFNSIWKGTPKSTAATEHTFAPIYASAANIPTISILPSWKPTLKALVRRATDVDAPPPTILLAGPKGAGKSTLSRILVNRLLTTSDLDAVAYLDVDPGQPEFSPPGTISLSLVHNPVLGPPFTHSPSPTRCHHIGYNSPREDPGHYMRAIIDLLSVHRQSHPAVPLLINTAGWIKGLGLELLQDIVANSQATDVVFLGSGGQAVAEIIPPKTAVLHELASAALSSPTRFTSADLRTLHTMAYFHRFSCGRQGPDFSTPLTGFAPWVIPYTGADRGVDAVHILGETTIASDELRTAIEGTIVGIVVVAEHDLPESFTPISIPSATATTATTAGCKGGELLPPILETALSPQVADCKGLGVIRAIDAANGHIHLVSPIAEAEIEGWERQGKRVVLARGRLELPVWEMLLPRLAGGSANKIGGRQPQQQGDGEEEEELPWISTGEGKRVGRGAVWRVRRNVMRRGQQ